MFGLVFGIGGMLDFADKGVLPALNVLLARLENYVLVGDAFGHLAELLLGR